MKKILNAEKLFVSFFAILLTLALAGFVRAAERELTIDILPVVVTAPGEDVRAKSEIPNDYCGTIVRNGAKIVEETGCNIKFQVLPTRRIVSPEYADATSEEHMALATASSFDDEALPKRAIRIFFVRSYSDGTQSVKSGVPPQEKTIIWAQLLSQKSILIVRKDIEEQIPLASVVCGRAIVAFANGSIFTNGYPNLMRMPPSVGENTLSANQITRIRQWAMTANYAYYPPVVLDIKPGMESIDVGFKDLITGRKYMIEKSADMVTWEVDWTGSFGQAPAAHRLVKFPNSSRGFVRISCLGD